MTSTRSSDYEALGGGSDGGGNGSQLSRLLARGLPPEGKGEEDNDSAPVAFDVDDGNGGKNEVNGECEGDGNSDGPVDSNDINNHDVDDNDGDVDGGGGGQKRKCGTIVEEWEEMEVEEEKVEEAECVTLLNRKSKLGMNEVALFEYFNTRLEETTECPNKRCTCLAILGDASARASVAKYLTWFEQKNKYKQDSIVFEWFRYSSFLKPRTEQKRTNNKILFCLPYVDDGTAIIDEMVRIHLLCLVGLRLILAFGKKRYGAICNASKFTSVMPAHKNIGRKNYNAIKRNDQKYEPLMRHFKYLKNLGEVRSTRVVATLVNGMQGHANCDNSLDVTYLPILLGYRSCYKRHMALLGYVVRTTAMGAFIVMGEEGKEVDAGEYCSFPTYFNLWKHDIPELKVSRPVEDICKDCYTFANCHR
jgi:hypothetical protein